MNQKKNTKFNLNGHESQSNNLMVAIAYNSSSSQYSLISIHIKRDTMQIIIIIIWEKLHSETLLKHTH